MLGALPRSDDCGRALADARIQLRSLQGMWDLLAGLPHRAITMIEEAAITPALATKAGEEVCV
jgi:hypothetical protein